MRLIAVVLAVVLCTGRAFCADDLVTPPTIRPDTSSGLDSSGSPLRISAGLRVGISDNPSLSFPEWNDGVQLTCGQSQITGGQIGIEYSTLFEVAVGYDHMATPFRRGSTDDLFNTESSLALNFLYVSPGLYFGRHPSSQFDFGVHIDIGMGWAHLKQKKESTFSADSISPEPQYKTHAISIRPKLSVSYCVWRGIDFRLESGWLWADISGVSRPYFENFPGTSEAKPYVYNFRGPFVVAMLSISGPISKQI